MLRADVRWFVFLSLLMEGSYSQTEPVNVSFRLGKAKWLLNVSQRSRLNVPLADEKKEGGKQNKMLVVTGGEKTGNELEETR